MNRYTLIAIALAALVLGYASFYTVSEVEQVVITQFGEPRGAPIVEPGPHFKLPFIQKVHRFDKRWLEWDGEAAEMPTREKTYVWVDIYARWRISDPLKFFISVVNERAAHSRLDDIIDSETRNVIASHNLIEVVRSTNRDFVTPEEAEALDGRAAATTAARIEVGRDKLTRMILERAAAAMPAFGIELVDVQFQRVNYTDSVQKKVFERMVSERKRIAELYRSEGQGKRAEIIGKKDRELKTIESEAYRKVQEVRGRADASATHIYAEAYNRDPQLYKMLKSLETYQHTLSSGATLLLSTKSDFLRTLVDPAAR